MDSNELGRLKALKDSRMVAGENLLLANRIMLSQDVLIAYFKVSHADYWQRYQKSVRANNFQMKRRKSARHRLIAESKLIRSVMNQTKGKTRRKYQKRHQELAKRIREINLLVEDLREQKFKLKELLLKSLENVRADICAQIPDLEEQYDYAHMAYERASQDYEARLKKESIEKGVA